MTEIEQQESPAAATVESGRPTGADFHVQLSTDDGGLASVAEQWESLYRRCPAATPFQSWAWVHSWWGHYGEPGRLRLFLIHQGDVLVAAAPLMAISTGGLNVWRPVGSGISDWSDVLVDPSVASGALEALQAALLSQPGWDAVEFPEASPGAAARQLLDRWPGRRDDIVGSLCQEIDAAPMDDLVASLSRTNRANVRRALRKIDTAGLTSTMVPSDDVGSAVARLLQIHLQQWEQRGAITPEHKRPRFSQHLTTAAATMIPRGQAALCEYRMDGSLVASSLFLIGHDSVGGYLYGVDPELYRHFNVTTLMMRTAMDLAVEHGCSTFSLLRGREQYKSEWRPTSTHNSRLILCRPRSARGLLYLRAVQGRERAVDAVRTHAPRLGSTARRLHHSVRNPRLAVRAVGTAVDGGVRRLRRR